MSGALNRSAPHRIIDNWRRVSMRCRRIGVRLSDDQARDVSKMIAQGTTLSFAIKVARVK